MASNLERRLKILEHRSGSAGAVDEFGALWRQMAQAPDDPEAWAPAARAFVETMDDQMRANFIMGSERDHPAFARILLEHGVLGPMSQGAAAYMAGRADDLLDMVLQGLTPAELIAPDFQALDAALMEKLWPAGETDGAVGPLPGALVGDDEHEDKDG
jgi:hypothetical protein